MDEVRGLAERQEIKLEEIAERLKLAAEMVQGSAYDLALLSPGADVSHLLLAAETVERIMTRIGSEVG